MTDDDDDDDDEPQSELRSVDPTDTPSTPYTGQLVWARFLKFPYWPAIVLSSDATQDESKDTIFRALDDHLTLISVFVFTFSSREIFCR